MASPVISVAQMRAWEDATWASGQTSAAVIERVGRAVAERMLSLTPPGAVIVILAGRGHNGDDARAARKWLVRRKVVLMDVADPQAALKKFGCLLQSEHPRWIIDGLFGIGLNRPLDTHWRALIEAVNNSGVPVFAIDVPSGVTADITAIEGAAIRASLTLTVGAVKRGLLKIPDLVGQLEVATDIGLLPCPFKSELNWTLPDDFRDWPPRRRRESNKGTYGHVTIVAGSLGYHGAAVLAVRGALRAQPGLVTVATQPAVYFPVAAQLQAAMVHPWSDRFSVPKNCTAIVFGPGLAQPGLPPSLKKQLHAFWKKSPFPTIVDASALDWLPAGATRDQAVRVITPHPGEAARLLDTSVEKVQSDRLAALRELSRRLGGCYVVLKGHQTLVGRATGPVFVNSSGNPLLAQGGSGDLLSGFLAGLLAQPRCQLDPLKTIRLAVWRHGVAADEISRGQPNWTVEDLAGHLGVESHNA